MSAWGALEVTGGGEGGRGVSPPTGRGGGLGVLSQNCLRKSVIWSSVVHSEVRLPLSSRPADILPRQGRSRNF